MTEPALAVSVSGKGRHYRHPATGDLYPSVTNIIDVLDKPFLMHWAAREVAGAAWDQRHALAQIEDRDMAVDMLKSAHRRKRDRSAATGTVIHGVAEALIQGGKLPEFGDAEEPYLDAFMQFVTDFDPVFRVAEGTVFSEAHGYAGTFDFLAAIGDFLVLGDHKTGSGLYPEVALQLAALRHGDSLWDPLTGKLTPMPKVDACIALHLRPDGYKAHIIEAGEEAFSAFLGALAAWPWKKGGDSGAVGPVMNKVRLLAKLDVRPGVHAVPAQEAT